MPWEQSAGSAAKCTISRGVAVMVKASCMGKERGVEGSAAVEAGCVPVDANERQGAYTSGAGPLLVYGVSQPFSLNPLPGAGKRQTGGGTMEGGAGNPPAG